MSAARSAAGRAGAGASRLAMPCSLAATGPALVITPSGERVRLESKAAALMGLIALEKGITRRRVAALLWPETSQAQARSNLRTLMTRLARRLRIDFTALAANPDGFNAAVSLREPEIGEALELLESEGGAACTFLQGADDSRLEEFSAWLEAARDRIRRRLAEDLLAECEAAHAGRDISRAIRCARALVLLWPTSEEFHRRLMGTLASAGDTAAALEAYESCKATLLDRFGVLPDPTTRALHVRILRGEAALDPRPGDADADAPLDERRQILAAIEKCVAASTHCVVRGEAGIGKSFILRKALAGRRAVSVSFQSSGRTVPYAAVAQLLVEVNQRVSPPTTAAAAAELAIVAPAAFPEAHAGTTATAPSRLTAALQQWASSVASVGVELIALDDLHHADLQSQVVLASLLQDPLVSGRRPCMLLGHRSGELQAGIADAIEAARSTARLRVFTLERLSRESSTELLHLLGHTERTIAESVGALHQQTGGNPFFLIELTRSWRGHQRAGETGDAAQELGSLIRSRVLGSPEEAQQLAFIAAVAGDDFSVELAEHLTSVSPLELMPAWMKLQERGLFDDAGLAHDLVRESVRAMVPLSIAQALHRRVAEFLVPRAGSRDRVLHHYLHARQFEAALPFALALAAAHRRAGVDEGPWQHELLQIIAGLSDDRLPGAVWSTAGLKLWTMPPDTLPRLSSLVARIESLPRQSESTRAWLVYERARLLHLRDGKVRDCYDGLRHAVETLAMDDRALAWCSVWLCMVAVQTGHSAVLHAKCAHEAAGRLPAGAEDDYIRAVASTVHRSFVMSVVESVAETARSLRASRRLGDGSSGVEDRTELARLFNLAGHQRATYRHFAAALSCLPEAAARAWCLQHILNMGPSAVVSGHYSQGIRWLEWWLDSRSQSCNRAHPTLAWTWQVLGNDALARKHAFALHVEELEKDFALCVLLSVVRSRLERADGAPGTEPIRQGLESLARAGAGSVYVARLEMELAIVGNEPSLLEASATRLVNLLRPPYPHPGGLSYALLCQAEARFAQGDSGYVPVALEAASLICRHRMATHYAPELLWRAAALLDVALPEKAAALRDVAQRWIARAVLHVPESERASFAARNERLATRRPI